MKRLFQGKKLVVLMAAVLLAGGFFITAAQAATLNVTSDSVNAAYYGAVVKTADRLVVLQNGNGSWDWTVTGATGPTATTYLNISGVTAEGLLSAYKITGQQAYLDAAKKTGDYIISSIDASSPKNINAYNVLFLQKLADASGDTSYATKAGEYFGLVYSATPTTVCASGCNDTAGLMAGQKAKRGVTTIPDGIVLWDLTPYVEYATLVNDTTHAGEIEDAIVAVATDPAYVNTIANYDLGLASALKSSSLVNDAPNAATISGILAADTDGSFGKIAEGKDQVTSYALRALKLASDSRADAAAAYLVNASGRIASGGWVDTDGSEYSEVDSEAVTALVTMMPQIVQYYSVRDAIDAATSSDTINVGAGTYTEAGPIIIDKDISVVGESSSAVSIMAGNDTGNTGDSKGWFLVNAGKTFNISKVTLDGAGRKIYQAIRYNGSGVIDNVKFSNLTYEPSGPAYKGGGVRTGDGSQVDVTNSTFDNIGRVGIIAEGGTGTFSGNTYTGKGAGDWLDYAFDIEYGANITISNNQISHNRGVASSDGSTSAGISVWDDAGTQATLRNNNFVDNTASVAVAIASGATDPLLNIGTGNIFSNSDFGLDIQSVGAFGSPIINIASSTFSGNITGINVASGMTVSNIMVQHNTFSNNTTSIAQGGIGDLSAVNNWWGTASSTEIAAKISGSATVNFNPWYANAAMTALTDGTVTTVNDVIYNSTTEGQADLPSGATEVELSDTTVMDFSASVVTATSTEDVSIGGNMVTLTQSVTLQSGVDTQPIILTNAALANISASIPDGTKIQGPAGWDGKIAPPVAGIANGTAPAGFSVGNTVISIGSLSGTLVFDSPVTILLSGVTGAVGYQPSGSSAWTKIVNTCGGSYDTPTAPTRPGECAISDGTDTKILTYHFTSFAGLNVVTPPSSGGGGGGALPAVYCSSVTYGAWGGVSNGVQYRNVISRAPNICVLTDSQTADSSRKYGSSEETLNNGTTTPEIVPAPVVLPQVLGVQTYANGTLVRGSDQKIYVVVGGQLKHIVSLAELGKYAGHEILKVSDSVIASYGQAVLGAKAYADGALIRGSDKKIYVIMNGKKAHIRSLMELRKYIGKPINDVSDDVVAQH